MILANGSMLAMARPRYGIRKLVSAAVVCAVDCASSAGRLIQEGDVRVDPFGGRLAALRRLEHLLLEQGDQDVVGVLGQPRLRDADRVDLVEDGDLRIARRVRRVGVVFEIADRRLHRGLMAAEVAQRFERVGEAAVGELEPVIPRADPRGFLGRQAPEGAAIGQERLGREGVRRDGAWPRIGGQDPRRRSSRRHSAR